MRSQVLQEMGPGRGQLPITMRSNPSIQMAPNKGPSACCTEPLTLCNLRSESGVGSGAMSGRHLGPPWWLRPCQHPSDPECGQSPSSPGPARPAWLLLGNSGLRPLLHSPTGSQGTYSTQTRARGQGWAFASGRAPQNGGPQAESQAYQPGVAQMLQARRGPWQCEQCVRVLWGAAWTAETQKEAMSREHGL